VVKAAASTASDASRRAEEPAGVAVESVTRRTAAVTKSTRFSAAVKTAFLTTSLPLTGTGVIRTLLRAGCSAAPPEPLAVPRRSTAPTADGPDDPLTNTALPPLPRPPPATPSAAPTPPPPPPSSPRRTLPPSP
jgi:hypothetical protein